MGVKSGVQNGVKIGVPVLEGQSLIFEPKGAILSGGILGVFLDPCFWALISENPILVRLVLIRFLGISEQEVRPPKYPLLGPFLDQFWDQFGTILGPFWYHFRTILG